MDISRALFPFEIVSIIEQVLSSHFVAIDLELSGIPVRPSQILDGSKGKQIKKGKPTLQEVYSEARNAAKKFQILQFGLTIVEETNDGTYVLRPYNFYISPVPEGRLRMEREWSFSSGAVDFLLRHRFQFDKPYTEGVPYVSRQEERNIRASWAEQNKAQEAMADMEVKAGDKAWVQLVKDNITNWLDTPSDSRDVWFNLPPPPGTKLSFQSNQPLNAWQRRMIYQIVRNDFPALTVSSKNRGSFMQVAERQVDHEQSVQTERQRYREKDLAHAIEFRWLIEALIGGNISNLPLECHKANLTDAERSTVTEKELQHRAKTLQDRIKEHRTFLVVHNLFLDMVNIYQCFIGDLPESVGDFRAILSKDFEAIIDTKWIATFKTGQFESTTLESIEYQLRSQPIPKVQVAEGFDKYVSNEVYHEAGFDSYMTALAAIKLAAKRKANGAEHEAGASLDLFGIERPRNPISQDPGEVFCTPPESLNGDLNATRDKNSRSRSHSLLSKPITTVKEAVARMKPGNKQPKEPTKKGELVSAQKIETVRQALADTTISDDKGGSKMEEVPQTAKKTDPAAGKNNMFSVLTSSESDEYVEAMAQRGEVMPGWNDREFWKVFGNRLKVQACTEGVFDLGP